MRNIGYVLLLAVCLTGCKPKPETGNEKMEKAAQLAAEAKTEPTEVKSQSSVAEIFSPDIIGVDLAYFEQVAGVVARRTHDNTKEYRIDGCDIEVRFDRGQVSSLRIPATADCSNFSLNHFLPGYDGAFPPLHKLTHGAFNRVAGDEGGQFYADCLGMCGNAYDPSVYQSWTAARVHGGLEVILETLLVNDAGIDASFAWRHAMAAEQGEDWVLEGKFNCTRQYDSLARRLFVEVPVSAIQIGYGLPTPAGDSCN